MPLLSVESLEKTNVSTSHSDFDARKASSDCLGVPTEGEFYYSSHSQLIEAIDLGLVFLPVLSDCLFLKSTCLLFVCSRTVPECICTGDNILWARRAN